MNKIGILTYHHVVNWGSVLQAYCLQKFLERLYPMAAVEIIDYTPRTSFLYSYRRIYKKKLYPFKRIKNKRYLKKQSVLQSFLKANCNFSKEYLCSDSIEDGRAFILKQHYDMVVVGSDTVFQLGPNFGGKYIAAPQAPNLYFLPFDAPFKKLAFAVSANPFHPDMIQSIAKENIRDAVNDFDILLYRDKATREALKILGTTPAKLAHMVDPTLMVDFGMLVKPNPCNGEKYAAIAVGNPKITKELCETLFKSGFIPIVLLGNSPAPEVQNMPKNITMQNYLSLHRNLGLIVTDRFHSSIISLTMGAFPVIGIEETERYPDPNSKLRDLFERLDLSAMLFRYDGQPLDNNWIDSMLAKWNYDKIDIISRFETLRDKAIKTLKEVICL